MGVDYERRTTASRRLFERAEKVMAGGVSHNARYYEPYPIYVKRAAGKFIWDEDGNRYVDYWMGHMALILGHSPPAVVRALEGQVRRGTHYGMGSRLSVELAEEVHRTVPCAEMVRFCNTGAEATMYLVRLARGFTRRRKVLKMAGGWHGYNTELNKGVHRPFDATESLGILKGEQEHVHTVRFNDVEEAERAVREFKGDVAVVLLEPVLGAGGCIPAEREYIKALRELADREGALLAFDEIITGYRVSLGGAQERYGVIPDIAALGKIVGGGLPIGVVCGKKEIMSMADPRRKEWLVAIGGGTFSENPLTMTAGLTTIRYLRKNRSRVYPTLEKLGNDLRKGVDEAFSEKGLTTHTTGMGSLFLTHFSNEEPRSAEESASGDLEMQRKYALWLISKGIFVLPGHPGGVSLAHDGADVERLVEVTSDFASKMAGVREKS